MTESYPSKRAIVVDVPEIGSLTSEFVYNYFTPDEQNKTAFMSLSASSPQVFKSLAGKSNYDANVIGSNFLRLIPRYNLLNWQACPTNRDIVEVRQIAKDYNVKDLYNSNKIYDEETLAVKDFTTVSFQDTQQDGKMNFFISKLLDSLFVQNTSISQGSVSQLDVTRFLNANTDSSITPAFLSDAIKDMSKFGFVFDNNQVGKADVNSSLLAALASVKTDIQFNNKFIFSILQTTRENPIGFFNDEISNTMLSDASRVQTTARQNNPSGIIQASDYNIDLENIVNCELADASYFDSSTAVIGYLIEKQEIAANGSLIAHDPIFVENPFASAVIDWNVKYGSGYMYTIRTVALFNLRTFNADTAQILKVTIAVKSKPISISVVCKEQIPPPPPADFSIIWNHDIHKPVLTWALPVNSQRDVKYFQIFRRKSINDPFELLALYDFDDSESKSQLNEQLIRGWSYGNTEESVQGETSLVIKSMFPGTPILKHIDTEFDKHSSRYIYTVCCVDAHGYSSNYGPQHEVWFNKQVNRLERRLASRSGAPKSYPNFFILRDLFSDTLKVSGAKKINVYFNPETIYVYRQADVHDGRTEKQYYSFIETKDRNSCYKLQMINIDLQQQQVYTACIKDSIINPPTTNFIDPRLITSRDSDSTSGQSED